MIGGGDPGVTGGIAFLRCDDFEAEFNVQKVELFKMPVSPYTVTNKDGTEGNRNEMDFLALCRLLEEVMDDVEVHESKCFFIERPEPWGLTAYSALSLGSTYAALHQAAIDFGFTVYNFRPKDWKAEMGIPPKSKKPVSVAMAKELFPEMFYNLDKASTDGVAEALLMAELGRRRLARN